MGATDQTSAALSKSSRILIACDRCKARKHRCDGGKPKCGNCTARSLECEYPAIRRKRGPGKKTKSTETPADSLSAPSQVPPSFLWRPAETYVPQPEPPTRTSGPWMPIAADFLLPGVFEHRASIQGTIDEVIAGRRQYTPLLPQHISSSLIRNSFEAIMAEHPLLDLPQLVTLVEEQYAASLTEPADNPARWALVNAVFALALRFKIAPGAEGELSTFPRAFYRNAVTVLPELILQDPSLLSVQALVAMAMFAQACDSRSFAMLMANASRELELLRRAQGQLDVMSEEEQLSRAYGIASALEALAAQTNGIRPLLHGSGG